jgi:hypothetical protein
MTSSSGSSTTFATPKRRMHGADCGNRWETATDRAVVIAAVPCPSSGDSGRNCQPGQAHAVDMRNGLGPAGLAVSRASACRGVGQLDVGPSWIPRPYLPFGRSGPGRRRYTSSAVVRTGGWGAEARGPCLTSSYVEVSQDESSPSAARPPSRRVCRRALARYSSYQSGQFELSSSSTAAASRATTWTELGSTSDPIR